MKQNTKIFFGSLFFLVVLIITYSNHFDNGFYFDDTHTIVHNEYIRDLDNIPEFFTNPETVSTLPTNRSYRPIVTLMNAIDYNIAGGLDPFYFHLSIFFWYVVQCVLLFFFFRKILRFVSDHHWNGYIALFITAWYALHTANAETVNYIISRSDSFSTLCIVGSFVLYQNKKARKWYLYLLTMVLGLLAKQTGLVFVPLLFLYIMFFEEKLSVKDLLTFRKYNRKSIGNLFRKFLPAFVIGVAVFLFNQQVMTPNSKLFTEGEVTRLNYFLTQQYVVLRYIGNFFVPLGLSADSTVPVIKTMADQRVIFGMIVHLIMLITASLLSAKKKYRPVAFGILWFYVALVPSSSFHPLSQVSNDHRVFFPYIGLVLAVGWVIGLFLIKHEESIRKSNVLKTGTPLLVALIISVYAYGAYQRNIVWDSAENLWKDAAMKGPENGRALMNYGLTQMEKGRYDEALEYFKKTEEIMPRWSYIHINLGILNEAMGNSQLAEQYFENAIRYQPFNPEGYYYYARWLNKKGYPQRAIVQLKKGLQKSPGHISSKTLLKKIQSNNKNPSSSLDQQIQRMKASIEDEPTADKYIQLSVYYYRLNDMKGCIEASREALEINPKSARAYNNICSAYNRLKEWENAIEACNKALEIAPDFERAKNNLKWAKQSAEKDKK